MALKTNNKKYPFRPPGGKLNIACLLYLLIRRVPVIYWTLISGDTYPSEKRPQDHIVTLIQKQGGAVVLAHDFNRVNKDTELMVLNLTKSLLDMASKNNMNIITVSELLAKN